MDRIELSQLPVDIMVTYRCNLNCKKCYAPKQGDEATFDEITEILDKLYEIGVRRIVLTGGEPTVREDVVDIARYASAKGFNVYLSTNGILLKQIWEDIFPYLSWISISLDAPSAELEEKITGESGPLHFRQVVEFLKFYKTSNQVSAKIKLGTVVTSENREYIARLGEVIFEKFSGYVPDVWRFYQFSDFSDYNDNHKHIDNLSIPPDDFKGIMYNMKYKFPQANISHATAEERDESYVFVKPDLTLAYSSKGDYISLGNAKAMSPENILDALHQIDHIWGKCVMNRLMYS